MKKISLLLAFILAGSILISCKEAGQPYFTSGPKTPVAGTTSPASKTGAETKWDAILAEAKKEGSVTVYSLWRPQTRVSLSGAFTEKYGIRLEFSPFSRGSDLLAKLQAEQRAGLYAADVFGAGGPTILVTMKPAGLVGPIRPLLVLPEVLDQSAWIGGNLPFIDKESLAISMIGHWYRNVVVNSDIIKAGEITTIRDLLKPQYKGKITLNDPSVTGAGNFTISHLGHTAWGEEETLNFLRRLIKEQDLVIQRDNRLHIESVARGKYAIGLGPLHDFLAEFMAMGAPVKVAEVEEDNRVSTGAGAMALPTRFAHPNATIVFVNWLLTREGQKVFATSFGSSSTRIGASPDSLNALFIPQAGRKYHTETEEFLAARDRWLELSKKVMDEAAK